jgi:hypothetical protein
MCRLVDSKSICRRASARVVSEEVNQIEIVFERGKSKDLVVESNHNRNCVILAGYRGISALSLLCIERKHPQNPNAEVGTEVEGRLGTNRSSHLT